MSENRAEVFALRREKILRYFLQLKLLQRNYREVRKVTGECREVIYYYFGQQDEKFYATLSEFFVGNRPALKMIEFLILDLKDVKIKTFRFFEQYGTSNPLEQGRNFARDLRDYSQLILDRFRVEEEYLLPLLRRMAEESGQWMISR